MNNWPQEYTLSSYVLLYIAGHGRDVNNMFQHYYLYVLSRNEKNITLIFNLKILFYSYRS